MSTLPDAPQIETTQALEISTPQCRFCNDLAYDRHMEYVPMLDWIEGITQSSCEYCHVLVQAIQKLDPGLLSDKTQSDKDAIVDVHPSGRPGAQRLLHVGRKKNGWSRNLLSIELYTGNDNPSDMAFVGIGRDISPTAGDDSMWTFLRDCLYQCTTSHPLCSALQNVHWFPDRLLRLNESSTGGECDLQLIETALHRPTSRYITLSHCWGGTVHLSTTKSNLNRHCKGIPFTKLPQTFKDCVAVAHKLGVQYVWIDSLCIIQDQRSDWAHNSQMMDKVYENALFTVTAVSSPDSSTPFLGPDAPNERHKYQHHDIDVSTLSKTTTVVKARKHSPEISPGWVYGPLEFRAWAWQERHLSVRTVDFTTQQVHWHCATANTCECRGVKGESDWKKAEKTRLKTARKWREDMEDYSQRHLTYWTDRLPALSGTASRYSREIGSEYIAGLWISDFPRCLAWYRRELNDCSTGKPRMQRSPDNGVPSWSWASVSDNVYWMWATDFDQTKFNGVLDILEGECYEIPIKSCVELVSYECQPLNPENGFGEVKPGSFIDLRGQVIEAEMESDIYGCGLVRRKDFKPQLMVPDCHIVGEGDIKSSKLSILRAFKSEKHDDLGSATVRRGLPTDRLNSPENGSRRSKGIVTCLLLFTKEKENETRPCILVLSRQPSAQKDVPSTYQRIGISAGNLNCSGPLYKNRKDWDCWEGWEDLCLWENWEEWFADAEEKELRIL
ncbi:HET-domain-containing protein [Acephala macrosclerotiorum]|nr:HET-domain-containing protein [Acephala macrosclerotiorum]